MLPLPMPLPHSREADGCAQVAGRGALAWVMQCIAGRAWVLLREQTSEGGQAVVTQQPGRELRMRKAGRAL